MSAIPIRLREGQRWPAAELVLRAMGLVMLLASGRLVRIAGRLAFGPAEYHRPLSEYAVCLGAVLLLSAGIALMIEGPGLFHHVQIPGRTGNS